MSYFIPSKITQITSTCLTSVYWVFSWSSVDLVRQGMNYEGDVSSWLVGPEEAPQGEELDKYAADWKDEEGLFF